MESLTLCQICKTVPQKYCCPRCNILYCSVKCYQNPLHSTCSESFYQQCIAEELAIQQTESGEGGSSNTKNIRQLYDILKKNKDEMDEPEVETDDDNELDSDDEESTNLSNRLEGIDLDDADAVWSALTSEERQKFENLLKENDVGNILPDYSPWWTKTFQAKLISDISTERSFSKNQCLPISMPAILDDIKDFSAISQKPPADCVRWNLINILTAYCIVVRYFNGDHWDSPSSFAFYLYQLSANLKEHKNFENRSGAITSAYSECIKMSLSNTVDGLMDLLEKDMNEMIQGPWTNKVTNLYALAALSDCYRLCNQAKNTNTTMQVKGEFTKKYNIRVEEHLEKIQLRLLLRKLEYFLSFAKQF